MASSLMAGLYDTYVEARETVLELEEAGIPPEDIGLVSCNGDTSYAPPVSASPTRDVGAGAGTGASIGAVIGGGAGLLAGLGVVAVPGFGPVAAVGWLAATAIGALAGAGAGATTGGLIGAVADSDDVSGTDLRTEAARRGGAVVTVHADDQHWPMVEGILRQHRSLDPVERERDYLEGGWDGFDAHLPPEVSSFGPAPRPEHHPAPAPASHL